MNSQPRPSLVLALLCLALFANAAFGQSLSITKNGESEFLIGGAAPADTRYVLQASRNTHLWVDINDQVSGPVSNRFDGAGATELFFRLASWTPPASPIIIVLIGDSTVADFVSDLSLFNGWGQGIYGYFKSNARVVNLGMPEYSTKLFLNEAEYTQMVTIKPDYVLVQFGWFDAYTNSPGIGTTLEEYADNLKTIVQTIRGFNGTPILMTPPVVRQFAPNGKVDPTVPDRCAVVRELAVELQTHLIDLNQLTNDLFNELGDSGSAYISSGPNDKGHYSDIGAQVIAGLVVNGLPDSLGPYLVGIFNPRPKP